MLGFYGTWMARRSTALVGILLLVAGSVASDVAPANAGVIDEPESTISVLLGGLSEQVDRGDVFVVVNSVSDDGRFVVFNTAASDLVDGDDNGERDLYVLDAHDRSVALVSSSVAGTPATGESFDGRIAPDGSFVVYRSLADDITDDPVHGAFANIFIWDRASETNHLLVTGLDGPMNGYSHSLGLSPDGELATFTSYASNLTEDPNGMQDDGFIVEIDTGAVQRVSRSLDEESCSASIFNVEVSPDNRFVLYETSAGDIAPSDSNEGRDVFLFDRNTDTTTVVSLTPDGSTANRDSYPFGFDPTGTIVYFKSAATDLGVLSNSDIYAYDIASGDIAPYSHRPDLGIPNVVPDRLSPGTLSPNGQFELMPLREGWNLTNSLNSQEVWALDSESNAMLAIGSVDPDGGGFETIWIADDGTSAIVSGHGYDLDGYVPPIPVAPGVEQIWFTTYLVDLDPDGDGVWEGGLIGEPDPGGPPAPTNTFVDDDGSVFEADIEWLAAEGVTKGCNPPNNDMFCPNAPVTRAQMAAFLVRALGLTDQLDDPFGDDDASIFEADIEKLAAAGITRGCNPPTNDMFCPNAPVTREQMAAFLVRALGYAETGDEDLFGDDSASIFEADIEKLAAAGVTRGCNPPANDLFCPDETVTREQMAAFLHRALG